MNQLSRLKKRLTTFVISVAIRLAGDLEATVQRRQALYQPTAALIRAYANIANDMEAAGYNDYQTRHIKSRARTF